MRKAAKTKPMQELFESNFKSIYGKLLYDARKQDTEIKLVTNETRFDEFSRNPRLKLCYLFDENELIMKFNFDKNVLNYPLSAGL